MKEITTTRRIKLVLYCSFAATVAVGLFWAIYWLATGEMPSGENKIRLTSEVFITLPFALPRIYDALIAGVVVVGAVIVHTSKWWLSKKNSLVSEWARDTLRAVLGCGLVIGLCDGLFIGIVFMSLIAIPSTAAPLGLYYVTKRSFLRYRARRRPSTKDGWDAE